jgi:hypothetical protein
MTDDPFESRLDHLFAVVDEPDDALAFRQALEGRRKRGLHTRRVAMVGAGLLGAGVAAWTALPALPRLLAGAGGVAQDTQGLYGKLATNAQIALGVPGIDFSHDGWMVAALGILAVAGVMKGLERLGWI